MANILVVDDEHGIRDLLSEILNDEGHAVDLAENAAQARLARQNNSYDLILLDIWMPDTDGVTLLKEWSGQGLLTMPVIMMSGHATVDTAVEATRIGAHSFLEKPITMQKLLKEVQSALGKEALRGVVSSGATTGVRTHIEPAAPAPKPAFATTQRVVDNVAARPTGSGYVYASEHHMFDLDKPLRDARDEFERAYFNFHLMRENGSMTRVAEKTGLERTHLYRKLKQLGVDTGKKN